MFKIGDKVVRKSDYIYTPFRQDEVYTVLSKDEIGIVLKEVEGCWFRDYFELAKPDNDVTEMSNQELADEWRAHLARQREIRAEMESRGFKSQWRAPHRNVITWRDHTKVHEKPDELRFYKVTTPAPIEETY